mmetsp:Transcript_17235/g.35502  ORF Transcript_17235/g.35502 Transcript_17235/m.35502 type:complete len:283 (-) Transcript_17235:34-882(-)
MIILILSVLLLTRVAGFSVVDEILTACPSTSKSAFLKDPTQINKLRDLVAKVENGVGATTEDSSIGGAAGDQIWRLRATAPKFVPPVKPPEFLNKSPFNELDVYQLVRDGETRVDNVIYSPKKKKKVTLVHKARSTGEVGGSGTKRTYLDLQSVVLSDVVFEGKEGEGGEEGTANIWRITKEVELGEQEGGGEGGRAGTLLIGDVKVEDLFGVNVPMPPINVLADSTAFETTYEDERLRITRGGNGLNAFGDFRVFERVVLDEVDGKVDEEGEEVVVEQVEM